MHRMFRTFRSWLGAGALALAAHAAHAEPVKLTWFMWSGSEAEVTAWKHVASLVTQKHPDITVEFQTTSFLDYWTKLPALAASNSLPDIVSLQSLRAPGFAELMAPLDDRIKADKFDIDAFDPSIMKGLSRNGKQFALPYDFGPLMLYYNHEMFVKEGVPLPKLGWTEADFMKAAKALTKDGKFGFSLSVPDAFVVFARSKGAKYLNDKGDLDLTNAGLKGAFSQYAKLVNDDKVAPLLPPTGSQSSTVSNGRFSAGNVAMYVDGPWQLINLKRKSSFTIGVAPVPAREAGSLTVSAGSGFGIAATSKNKDAAWKAIQVMTGPDAEKYLAEAGRAFPARKDFQKYWYDVAAEGVAGAREAIPAALTNAAPFVTTPNWATVASTFEQYAPLAFGGSETPDKVLETIQKLASQ
ncbi:sugar ABC transporter substrate-binding protein [Terrarubrum flagellatum]|uniref:ABC transporter substrate-binding protein n=1 Tax=Terrirubrum flagellatum TaxID=2895980 RepID=UPI00314568FA